FLSADERHGGHLLECRPHEARARVEALDRMELGLPKSDAYLHWDFHRDISGDLDRAER
ncbi:MAG: acetolactate decarboxylase, partial [Candidatus Promineifilaceae bacterium]